MVKNINKLYFEKNVYAMTDNGRALVVDEQNFLGSKPVVLQFYATWCGPCKMLAPIIEELDGEYDSKIDFYKINIEDEREISQAFNIQSIPVLVFIPTEGLPTKSIGAPDKNSLKEAIDSFFFNE
jgi:thioredoxin